MSFSTDSKRVLQLGKVEVRSALAKLLSRAMYALKQRDPNLLDMSDFSEALNRTILNGVIVAHLLGVKSVTVNRHVKRQRKLQLSFDSLLQVLQRQLDADVTELERIYETDVLRVVKQSTDSIERQLRNELTDLISNRVHLPDARQRFVAVFNNLGLTDVKSHQVEAIFNTQVAISYHAGQWNGYQDETVNEILWGYKYVSVGDDRVRPDHVAMDGTTLPKDDPFWLKNWPPNGWNCRCVVIPIFEERKPVPPKDVKIGDEPPRPPGADPGFNLNPGKVYPVHTQPQISPYDKSAEGAVPDDTPMRPRAPAGARTRPRTPATPRTPAVPPVTPQPQVPTTPTIPPAPPKPPPRPVDAILLDVSTQRNFTGPLPLPPAERANLQRRINKTRATRKGLFYATVPQAIIQGARTVRRSGTEEVADIPEHLVTDTEVRKPLGVMRDSEIILRVRTRRGDRVLTLPGGKGVFPVGKYRILSRRTSEVSGKRVLTITLEQLR